MKPTQLIILLLLLPLSGFTQSAWDYDSLPKRNPKDLGFTGYSNHVTDYYFIKTSKDGRKIKTYYLMGNSKKRDLFDCPGNIPTYTGQYDTMGKIIKQVSVSCHNNLHYSKKKENITEYTYKERDSFFVITSVKRDSMIEKKGYSEEVSSTGPDTTLLCFSKQTGYLVKEVNQQTGYVISYFYDGKQRLSTIRYPGQDIDPPTDYDYTYRYDTLEKDTIVLWVGEEKIYLRDRPTIILDDVTTTYTKYYFVNGIEVCECGSHGFFHKHALIKKRLWWLYRRENQKEEYKNKICDKWESETLYPIKINKRKTRKQYRYEYY